jgi:hypothetical protein
VTSNIVLAARPRPSFAKPGTKTFPPKNNEGRRSADRRIQPLAAPAGAAARPAGRARLSALHRGLAVRRGCRRFGSAPGRASWDGGWRRALTRRPRPLVQRAPRRPVVMPVGRCPEQPGSGVTNPARRGRTRSIIRHVTGDAPRGSENFGSVTELGTIVNMSLFRRPRRGCKARDGKPFCVRRLADHEPPNPTPGRVLKDLG